MDDRIRAALAQDRTIDITTIGRKSGQPHRIEIWFLRLDEKVYITGSPGRRDWYANLVAHPQFTFHLKGSVSADLPACATPITDPAARRTIMERLLHKIGGSDRLEAWVGGSPLVEVTFVDDAG